MRASLQVHSKWVDIDQLAEDPAILNGGTEAGEFFARRRRDPERAARLLKARKKLGQALDATYGSRVGLVALRMKAGLSQTELAQLIQTQQPSVARWERSPEKMGYETMEAWAKALGIDTMEVCAAIKAQLEAKSTVEAHETA